MSDVDYITDLTVFDPSHAYGGHRLSPDVAAKVCRCGHPFSHHDAGECWTRANGTETYSDDDRVCGCGWLTEVAS